MFQNPRRSRQARNFTTNVPKILDLKSSSEQIFFRKLSLGAPDLKKLKLFVLLKEEFLHIKDSPGGGALGYFLGGYVPPGTPNWHPVLKKNSPKIDTPF